MFKVECAGCQASYQVDERRVPDKGLRMSCPKCRTAFVVHRPDQETQKGGTVVRVEQPIEPAPRRLPSSGTMIGVPTAQRLVGATSLAAAPPPTVRSPGSAARPPGPPPPRGRGPGTKGATMIGVAGPQVREAIATARGTDTLVGVAPKSPFEPVARKFDDADLPAALSTRLPSSAARKSAASAAEPLADLPSKVEPVNDVAAALPAKVSQEEPLAEADNDDFELLREDELDEIALGESISPDSDALNSAAPAIGRNMSSLPSVDGTLEMESLNPDFGALELPTWGEAPAEEEPAQAGASPQHLAPETDDPFDGLSLELPSEEPAERESVPSLTPSMAGAGISRPPPLPKTRQAQQPREARAESGGGTNTADDETDDFASLVPSAALSSKGGAQQATARRGGAQDDRAQDDRAQDAVVQDAGVQDDGVQDDGVEDPEAGGTEYGQVNLGGSDHEALAEVGAIDTDDDMEFGDIPQEESGAASTGAKVARSRIDTAVKPIAAEEKKKKKAKQQAPSIVEEATRRKRRRRLKVGFAAVFVITVGGGALSLDPELGPFGTYAIEDWVKRGEHRMLLDLTISESQKLLAEDSAGSAAKAGQVVQDAQSRASRYKALAAYHAYVDYLRVLRFGGDAELEAEGRVALEQLTGVPGVPTLDLALAVQAAARRDFEVAQPSLEALGEQIPAQVALGELFLSAGKPEAKQVWEGLTKRESSPRALFGLARSELALGDFTAARSLAEQVLRLNDTHVGAQIMLAEVVHRQAPDDVAALRWLESVLEKPELASSAELVEAQSLLGHVHLAQGRISLAEKHLALALESNPQHSGALAGFGETLFRSGRFSQALGRFEAALASQADNFQAGLGVVKAKVSLERFDDAKVTLAQLAQEHPAQPEVGFWLGRVEEALGNTAAAEKAYRGAIEASARQPLVKAYSALAKLQSRLGNLDEAEQTLNSAREKLSNSPAVHKATGEVASSRGQYEQALLEFQQSLSLDPEDPEAQFLIATAQRKLKRYDEAMKSLSAVAALDENYPGLALERGILFEESGRTKEALKEYEAALAKAPDDPDLMLRVACAKVVAGFGADAEKLLRKVILVRATSAEANHCLGRALMLQNNMPEALRSLRRALEFDPNRAEYHLFVGWAANETGRQDLAARELQRALELDQGLADAYWQRGVLRRKQGAIRDAVLDLQKALELKPDRYDAHADLADVFYDLGQETLALVEWGKAVTAEPENATWRFRYGKLLLANLRQREATEHLQQAIELAKKQDPKPAWLWEAHHLTARSLGRVAEAVEHWQAFLQLGPPDSPYRNEAKQALAALGQPHVGP